MGRCFGSLTDDSPPFQIVEPIPGVANTVHFDYDKSQLRPEALPVLAGLAEWMRRYADVQILIAGHADESTIWRSAAGAPPP
jgi:outer membrane protein OmpA-like peptidoglycan-associated protein